MPAKLTFSGGEKIFGGTKCSGGGGGAKTYKGRKKPISIRKTKKSGDFFVGDSKKNLPCRGAKIFSRGAEWLTWLTLRH